MLIALIVLLIKSLDYTRGKTYKLYTDSYYVLHLWFVQGFTFGSHLLDYWLDTV
jgi:hypothetical protein